MKNKKAQGKIGKTLTWFVGFIIILFVLFLFILSSTVMAGSKRISSNWDSIELEKYNVEKLEMERVLIGLLEKESELDNKKMSVKELIFNFYSENSEKDLIKEKIQKESEEWFEGINRCYVLVSDTNKGDEYGYNMPVMEKNIMRLSNIQNKNNDIRVKGHVEAYKNDLLKKGIVFLLISENRNIKLKFYYGKCL